MASKKKAAAAVYETIDIASPHEQMSNSTVTISATFLECIHEIMKTYTHFTIAWPPKGLKYPFLNHP